jgi:hypothetical protein
VRPAARPAKRCRPPVAERGRSWRAGLGRQALPEGRRRRRLSTVAKRQARSASPGGLRCATSPPSATTVPLGSGRAVRRLRPKSGCAIRDCLRTAQATEGVHHGRGRRVVVSVVVVRALMTSRFVRFGVGNGLADHVGRDFRRRLARSARQLVELLGKGLRQRDLDASTRSSRSIFRGCCGGGSNWAHIGTDREKGKPAKQFGPSEGPARARASGLYELFVALRPRLSWSACRRTLLENERDAFVVRTATGVVAEGLEPVRGGSDSTRRQKSLAGSASHGQ